MRKKLIIKFQFVGVKQNKQLNTFNKDLVALVVNDLFHKYFLCYETIRNVKQLKDLEKPKFQQNATIKEEKKEEIFNQPVKRENSISKGDSPIIEEKSKNLGDNVELLSNMIEGVNQNLLQINASVQNLLAHNEELTATSDTVVESVDIGFNEM